MGNVLYSYEIVYIYIHQYFNATAIIFFLFISDDGHAKVIDLSLIFVVNLIL